MAFSTVWIAARAAIVLRMKMRLAVSSTSSKSSLAAMAIMPSKAIWAVTSALVISPMR